MVNKWWMLAQFIVLAILCQIISDCHAARPAGAKPVVVLTNLDGQKTVEFAPLNAVFGSFSRLRPNTWYDIKVVRSDGFEISRSHFASDKRGIIPTTALWWDVGVKYRKSRVGKLNLQALSQYTYSCHLTRGRKTIVEIPIGIRPVDETGPIVYSSDENANPLNGFIHRKEGVHLTGKNFPPGSKLHIYVVRDRYTWEPGDRLNAIRKRPIVLQLDEGQRDFTASVWPADLTQIGSYDVIVEYEAQNGVFDHRDCTDSHYGVGFTIFLLSPPPSPTPSPPQHIEDDLACQEPPQDASGNVIGAPNPIYKDTFSPEEQVWVAVNPRAGGGNYAGQTAKLYIVDHMMESSWTNGTALVDKSGGAEQTVIQPGCANVNYNKVWDSPDLGDYDVVVDFAPFDSYTKGTDIIDKLDAKGFVVPVDWICLESVSFNHNSTSNTSDALNIRMNYTEDVTIPEWKKATVTYPAAYIKNKNITIRAEFSAAQGVDNCVMHADVGFGSLGNVQSKTVSFALGNPRKGDAEFTVSNPTPNMIKSFYQKWDWYCEEINGTAITPIHLGSSKNRIYVVLAEPPAPWTTSGQSEPWAQALQKACWWANGQTTAAGAAEKVTQRLFNNVGGVYDTQGGAPFYPQYEPPYDSTTGKGKFAMTMFLNNIPNVSTVNCYDMGKSLVSFSNVVGCGLAFRYSDPFGKLNCILPIGCGWTNDPFGGGNPIKDEDSNRTGFGNHAFGSISDNIFDACMKVDSDSNPDHGPPFTETWLINLPWSTYKTMAVDDKPSTNTGYPSTHSLIID